MNTTELYAKYITKVPEKESKPPEVDDKLERELWLMQPYTIKFLKELTAKRDEAYLRAAIQSSAAFTDQTKTQAQLESFKALILTEILNYARSKNFSTIS